MLILLTTLNSQYIHTSLALYTLQAYCCRDFPEIQIAEFNINQDLDYILGVIYERQPQVLGISTNIWNITLSLELVDRVKKVLPSTIVVLGGPEASADYAGILARPGAPDFIICGDGEETLHELLTKLQEGQADLSTVAGLAFKTGTTVLRTPDRAPLDLTTIPFPYPDLTLFRDRILYYEASRGCPFQCAYCLSGWEKTKLRAMPLERVKADLLKFIKAGVRTVKLIDRTFNLERDRALAILHFLLEQGGSTEFHFELVGELLDAELIRLLRAAPPGRFRVEIGVQSTCAAALTAVHRRYDLERLKANCLALTARNSAVGNQSPTVHLDLIAGLPYEDLATFGQSFDWTFRLHPDELQLGFLKLLKGSPLREQAGEYGYAYTEAPPYEFLRNNWLCYGDLLHLKGVEEMVEKFFNSQHFRYTLAYLFRDERLSPWAFFSALNRFWVDRGLRERPQKQVTLFNEFWRFLTSGDPAVGKGQAEEELRDLLTLDYYLSGSGGKPPAWLTPESPSLRAQVKNLLRESAPISLPLPPDLTPSELRRRMLVLAFRIHPETWATGFFPLLVYLPAQGRPVWCLLPSKEKTLKEDTERRKLIIPGVKRND